MDPNATYEPTSLAVTSSDDSDDEPQPPNIVPILYSSLLKPEVPNWPSPRPKYRPRTPPAPTKRRSRSPAKRDHHNHHHPHPYHHQSSHRSYRPYPERPRHTVERRSEPLPPPAPREPKDEWETKYDRREHRRYYVNRYLGTSTWVKPSGKVRSLDD